MPHGGGGGGGGGARKGGGGRGGGYHGQAVKAGPWAQMARGGRTAAPRPHLARNRKLRGLGRK